MAEREIQPAPGLPIQELRTPNQRDGFITLLVNRSSDFYQAVTPIKRGQPYAGILNADTRTIDQFADNPLYFLREIRPGNSGGSDFGNTSFWVIWVFATQELAQDTYDAGVDYDGENPSCPIFTRVSTIKRKLYDDTSTIAFGTTLTGLMSVNLTGAGTGYTFASATVTGGGVAEAVCFGGQIIDWIVTRQGSGVASNAAMTIVGDGTGATATTRIQPASAVLVSQKKRELPEDDPQSHDYVQVIRVYSTLPGATVYDSTYDSEADIWITKSKQKKALSAITPSVTHSSDLSVTIVSIEGIDANTGYEVVTVIPKSPHFDHDTAIVEYQVKPYQFPGYIYIEALDLYGTAIGYRRTYSETTLMKIRTWFIIGDTNPVPDFDNVVPGDIVINDVSYKNVLHDETTRLYNSIPVTIPATIPSFTEYYGTPDIDDPFAPGSPPGWIGTERIVLTQSTRAGSEYRWKVVEQSTIMQ